MSKDGDLEDGDLEDKHMDKKFISVRYLNDSKLKLYNSFKTTHPQLKICRSSFYGRIPRWFQKPSKYTDLCPICEVCDISNIFNYFIKL
jgi:hypothetical protein